MRNKFLITLLGLLALTGLASAQVPVEPFLPFYWVTGNVISLETQAVVPNAEVYFYKDWDSGQRIETTTDANGNFELNVYDLEYYYGIPITYETETYYVGVIDGTYGTVEGTELTIAQGYTEFPASLVTILGGGPGETPPEGTVPIDIDRAGDDVGDDIDITWDNSGDYENPKFYVLIGVGGGVYTTETTAWQGPYDDGNPAPGFDFSNYSSGSISMTGQVGQGDAEIYVKAIQASIPDPTVEHPDYPGYSYIGVAWAVGKYDVFVEGPTGNYKYSFVSTPFESDETTSAAIFGNQLDPGDSKSVAPELWGWTGTTFGQQEYLDTASGWTTITGFDPISVADADGFVIKTKSGHSSRTITFVGSVKHSSFGPRAVGDNLYSFVGNPYPMGYLVMESVNFVAPYSHVGAGSGYADQFWGWTGNTFGDQIYYSDSGVWDAISGFSLISTLEAGRAFVYRRHPNAGTGFNWEFSPYNY